MSQVTSPVILDSTGQDIADALAAIRTAILSGEGYTQVGSITLSATWSGAGPYSQTVTVSGATVTSNSKVNIQLTAAQMASMISDGVQGIVVENNAGTLTVYAVGAAPSTAMTVQCTVEETV